MFKQLSIKEAIEAGYEPEFLQDSSSFIVTNKRLDKKMIKIPFDNIIDRFSIIRESRSFRIKKVVH